MKKAWKPYGVDINMRASGLKKCFKLWNEKYTMDLITTKRRSISAWYLSQRRMTGGHIA